MNFGYPWWMIYGHLALLVIFVLAALGLSRIARLRRLKWLPVVLAVWAASAFLVVKIGFRLDATVKPPTDRFLASGTGKVLDMGCGSGRASIGLLQARPGANVVGLDNWGADYIEGNGPDLILANADAAGVADRLTTESADMRELPFPDGSFDAVMSTYALDHLDSPGIKRAAAEAARVLRPGGELLLLNMNVDGWIRFAFPQLLLKEITSQGHQGHGAGEPTGRTVEEHWRTLLDNVGLEVVEVGRKPGTLYFLARKPAGASQSLGS